MNTNVTTRGILSFRRQGGAKRRAQSAAPQARVNVVRPRASQRGAALIVALILLIVITLVGLAAIGTTLIQNKATSNQYDRQIAFQSAEAAMRVALVELINNSNPPVSTRKCGHDSASSDCLANPFADPNLPTGSIITVAAGNAANQFTAGSNSPMQPQYVIQDLGNNWSTQSPGSSNGVVCNYGACNPNGPAQYWRVTARSCDPADARCDNRAIVTLQSIIKK